MDNLLPQFEPYKEKIPQFVIKLYHILQLNQYSDYLTWSGDSQILIKSPKKLQDKVLPHFFRHRHISSFIRQLNMYKFTKVIKLMKEKNYMYFKNEHFKRGEIRQLLKIKRNNKKSRKQNLSYQTIQDGQQADNISIDIELQNNLALNDYRKNIHTKIDHIINLLKAVENAHPDAKDDLREPILKCKEILQNNSQGNISMMNLEQSKNNVPNSQNMLLTMKYLPAIDHILFPSQCNF